MLKMSEQDEMTAHEKLEALDGCVTFSDKWQGKDPRFYIPGHEPLQPNGPERGAPVTLESPEFRQWVADSYRERYGQEAPKTQLGEFTNKLAFQARGSHMADYHRHKRARKK